MTNYIKKNGVIQPKEILFAPMLSTFGGGSSRGFNPGGGGPSFDYDFTSATFGNGGQTGRNPASDSTYLSNITGSTIPSDKISVSNGFITWTPPGAATFRITVKGARGLTTAGNTAGQGAVIRGDFDLDNTTDLNMMLGQEGTPAYGGAGGGMSVVAYYTDNTLLIVAGGGGGSSYDNNTGTNNGTANALATQTGTGVGGNSGNNAGETNQSSGGCGGAGGGGAAYDGAASGSGAAQPFTLSAVGGQTQPSSSGQPCVAIAYGGFGGGGGGGNTGPGGGGYYGGNGSGYSSTYYAGNGGSSYNNGSNQSNNVNNTGTGSITIEVV